MGNWRQIDEEGRRSIEQRGLIGHYVAGAYRVAARPIATRQIVLRARLLAFLWGMDEAANFVERLPPRYINPVLRAFGATIAGTAVWSEGLRLATVHTNAFRPLTAGHLFFGGKRTLVDLSHEVVFGDCCTLANDTAFVSHTDAGHSPLTTELLPVFRGPIRIGRGVYIGSGSIVTAGVIIGECAVIGANSLVMHDIPPYTMAAGSPAKVIKTLDRSKIPPFDPDEALIIPEGTTDGP